MKYAWIEKNKQEYPVKVMCNVLEVSRSGYYDWCNREPGKREKRRKKIEKAVEEIYIESNRVYGYRKVHRELVEERKIECCRETVRRIMKENQWYSKVKKEFVITTDSEHDYEYSENLLDREFEVESSDKVWAADITYIGTREGWLFLAVVMDLYSRKVVGWSMSKRIDRELVKEALGMALTQRGKVKGLIHHSDRGSQYCSDMYQNELEANGIICSMSRKGDCWDNACLESFFGSLKTEWTRDKQYETRAEAQQDVFKYIEMFCNNKRRHASLEYVCPAEYVAQHQKKENAA